MYNVILLLLKKFTSFLKRAMGGGVKLLTMLNAYFNNMYILIQLYIRYIDVYHNIIEIRTENITAYYSRNQ